MRPGHIEFLGTVAIRTATLDYVILAALSCMPIAENQFLATMWKLSANWSIRNPELDESTDRKEQWTFKRLPTCPVIGHGSFHEHQVCACSGSLQGKRNSR